MEVPNVSWEDIGGLENVKRELQEVCGYPQLDVLWHTVMFSFLINGSKFLYKSFTLKDVHILTYLIKHTTYS